MTDYTPTTEQVRDAYVRGMRDTFIASAGEHREEFERWVQAHDREVRTFVQPPTREQIAVIDRLRHRLRNAPDWANDVCVQRADLDAVLALFPQPTPSGAGADAFVDDQGRAWIGRSPAPGVSSQQPGRGLRMTEQAIVTQLAEVDSLTASDMAEKLALALTNYFSDGSDEFGHVIATRDGSKVHVVAVDEGDAEHDERERRYVITVENEAERDPLTDPANAAVVAELREAGRFTPPPLDEDRVVAVLRDKGLWKPEYDEPVSIADIARRMKFTAVDPGRLGDRAMFEVLNDHRGRNVDTWVHRAPTSFNSSTIRDVTPPPATPEEGDRG